MNDELTKQLHELADWVEKHNNVHCHSVPRKAAYLINKLEIENEQFRMLLNKRDLYFSDYVNRAIGLARYTIYKMKKKVKK